MDINQFWSVGGFWVGAGGLIIGLIGTIVAIKSRKRRAFLYSLRGNTIIEDYKTNLNNLAVLYQGKEIPNLSVCRLAFWNAGNDPIGGSDISVIDPLLVKSRTGYEILDVFIVDSSSSANGIKTSYSKKDKGYLIKFDYLNPKMGGVMQIIHTGKNIHDVQILGQIKGIKDIKEYTIPVYKGKNIPPAEGFVLSSMFIFGGLVISTMPDSAGDTPTPPGFKLFFFVIGLLMLLGTIIDLNTSRTMPSYFKSKISDLPFKKERNDSPLVALKNLYKLLFH